MNITIRDLSSLTVTPFEAVIAAIMIVGVIVVLWKVNKFEKKLLEEGRD